MPELHVVSTSTDSFDDEASAVVGALRRHFETGATKSLAWRRSQLDALEHLLLEREADFFAALRADLGKPTTEAFTSETGVTLSELRFVRKNLRRWMRPERVRTS